ncbi:hypothetical protein B296_00049938 [Ensete ventricosum]|uniref:Uncharacterized protein n=1 Tax=Ensete ventricosum TaxID=4639 RepID=A0A426XD52_ENSVE|nr:hypothetical protein B296_00049938 [Ensete ventricosum]
MGRSDSSKLMLDGQPRQHFGGSHVSPRDQVDSQSGIRGGGSCTTLPGPTHINVAWRAMSSPHAAAAVHSPYVSVTSRGTTKGPHWVTPPITEEACVQDCHPRDDPRDKPTDTPDMDH